MALCGEPDAPVNGGGWSDGRSVSFWCYGGYKVSGNDYLECVNGKWNGDAPKCVGTYFYSIL